MIRSLKARYVFPVACEPIADGVVTFDENRIISVSPASSRTARQASTSRGGTHRRATCDAAEIEDLGNVAILPGLVNAHTHLEFSHLAKPLGRPGMRLSDWINTLTNEFRRQGRPPIDAVRRGLQESTAAGTTTLGEIAQPDWSSNDVQAASIDATVFLELIAPTDNDVDAKLELARRHIAAARNNLRGGTKANWRPGLSPHAPYSVHPRLLSQSVDISAQHQVPLAMHLAESPEELEFLKNCGGLFRAMLERLGKWQPAAHPPGRRPLDILKVLAAAHRVLIIHGNYLDDEEIDFIAQRTERMSVVYCPRTHQYFNHQSYPLEKMLDAGVNVALGTDSRASAPDLSLLSEMRCLLRRHSSIDPATVLRLGTLCGARALGLEQETGTLEPGKRPDFCIVQLPDRPESAPYKLLFDPRSAICSTWFRGRESL